MRRSSLFLFAPFTLSFALGCDEVALSPASVAYAARTVAMPDSVRADMEHHLGADLSEVRVHTGAQSDTLNRAKSLRLGADRYLVKPVRAETNSTW